MSMSRIKDWKNKLLNLTKRNSLLNFKTSGSNKVIRIISGTKMNQLEDFLAAGDTLEIFSKEDVKEAYQKSEKLKTLSDNELNFDQIAEFLFKKDQKMIIVDSNRPDTEKKLLRLLRENRTYYQETGLNISFLALGILNYFDLEKKESLKAPLVLVPVVLYRKDRGSRFTLNIHDSESKFNLTLLEFLKRKFNISIPELEGDLPKDDSGLDIKKIVDIMKGKIASFNKPNEPWSVSEESYLSLFSFQKILMYKDLEQYSEDSLKEHPFVKALDQPSLSSFPNQGSFISEKEIDSVQKQNDIFCPLPYDSSQLKSVLSASAGKSFILQGPPGTGKSQTISNMISQLLCEGKKVLFVAEKMEALNVVQRRLKKVGLGDFFLELHSNKSKKSAIYKNLKENYEKIQNQNVEGWDEKCKKMESLKNTLNSYIKEVHKNSKSGLKVFDAVGQILNMEKKGLSKIEFSLSREYQKEEIDELKEYLDQIESIIKELNCKIQDHFFEGLNFNWSPNNEKKFQDILNKILGQINLASESLSSLSKNTPSSIEECFLKLPDYDLFSNFISHLERIKDKENYFKLAFDNDLEMVKFKLNRAKKYNDQLQQSLKSLSSSYRDDLEIKNILNLESKYSESLDMFFIKRFFVQNKVVKDLTKMTTSQKKIKKIHIEKDFYHLKKMVEAQNEIKKISFPENKVLFWDGLQSEFDILDEFLSWETKFKSLVSEFENETYFYDFAKTVILSEPSFLKDTSRFKDCLNQINKHLSLFNASLKEADDLGINFIKGDKTSNQQYLQSIKSMCDEGLNDINSLSDYLKYKDIKKKFLEFEDFKIFIHQLEKELFQPQNISDVFYFNYLRSWMSYVFESSEILKSFRGYELDDLIKRFKKLDEEILKLSEDKIKSKISSSICSSLERLKSNSYLKFSNGLSFIDRQSKLKKAHKSIRHLYREHPEFMQELAPCLLTSPISVSQYLPTEKINFDVVIFDEASQIPPWDAIGVILRAKKIIVVGDSKQLPPTSFFQTGVNDEDSSEQDNPDLESILEECETCGLKKLSLNWHYRSRHESLIAFSNQKYYDNKLITFPAKIINDKNTAIYYNYIEKGSFETETKTSQSEARAVCEKILSLIKNEDFKDSIGVVTFNQAQRDLIEQMLDKKRLENPDIEKYFSDEKEEPIIVKNLENIQGDERDIMIFSLGYGPIKNQNLSHNFGALNRSGGERRLNVAITRARKEMHLFTSLKYGMIDLKRTQATAVHDLKHFLEYAEKGVEALAMNTLGSIGNFDSPFEKYVAESLEKLGYQLKPQVGVGSFRIDIGVVDPNNPNEFIAGIECDGATYHSSATARDRDCVRQAVLEDLGWKILRIWSTDWWINSQKETQRIDQEIKNLISKS